MIWAHKKNILFQNWPVPTYQKVKKVKVLKKVLICAAFFTVCVIVLFQIMNAENHDLQNRVAQSEKQIEVLKKQLEGLSQPSTSVPSTSSAPSAGGWKRPANWQYGFGF